MLRFFIRSEGGSVGVLFGLCAVPLLFFAGAAVDYSRWAAAHTQAQVSVDAAALAAAASLDTSQATLDRIATDMLASTSRPEGQPTLSLQRVSYDKAAETITVAGEGEIESAFLKLAGYPTLPYSASSTALRPGTSSIEMALVLDNTWSMSDTDSAGVTKISALKSAAENLVGQLITGKKDLVKIGLVPYADYVNVGVENRGQPWLSVAADYSTTSTRTCKTQTTKNQCVKGDKKTCTRTVDGVAESYDCTPSTCTTVTVDPYETCSGGGTTNYKWYGCVGSRIPGTSRLTEADATITYPGLLATSRNCLNPIVPLTSDKSKLVTAIQSMIVNVGSYKPATYIPAGLIWGVNLLSPSAPFTEAAEYDPKNKSPRKVLILMTDGENTLRFDPKTGQHISISSNPTRYVKESNDDTVAVCTYAKSKAIEIYSVAFAVSDGDAKTTLRSCATDASHYFDAADSASLISAFRSIAESLSRTRITM